MITAEILRNSSNRVYGFKVNNHGRSIVCSAVSMLVINTVNSVKQFTEVEFECEADEKAGRIFFCSQAVMNGLKDRDFDLLMNSLVLGLNAVAAEYSRDFKLRDVLKIIQ